MNQSHKWIAPHYISITIIRKAVVMAEEMDLFYKKEEEMDLDDILFNDDEIELASFIAEKLDYSGGTGSAQFDAMTPEDILIRACSCFAIKCASALLNGETRVSVNLNVPGSLGMYPLHHAADALCPSFTEFFLCNGARTDFLSVCDDRNYDRKYAINIALWRLGIMYNIPDRTPMHSIFKLLAKLSLPRTQNALETIGLLAWATEATDKEFLYYARTQNLLAVAALLTVAREKLSDAVMHVREFYSRKELVMNEHKRVAVMPLLQVLDVYERAGDAIEAYVKKEKVGTTRDQAVEEFTCLLNEAGFTLNSSDTDLTDSRWTECCKLFFERRGLEQVERLEGNIAEGRREPIDIGMPHYSKSGFRWTGFNDLPKESVSNKKPPVVSMLKVPEEFKFHTAIAKPRVPQMLEKDQVIASQQHVPQKFKTDPAIARQILTIGAPIRRCARLDLVQNKMQRPWLHRFMNYFLQKNKSMLRLVGRS